jgi:hypothetical protein
MLGAASPVPSTKTVTVSNVGFLLALWCQVLNSFTRDLQTRWSGIPSHNNGRTTKFAPVQLSTGLQEII